MNTRKQHLNLQMKCFHRLPSVRVLRGLSLVSTGVMAEGSVPLPPSPISFCNIHHHELQFTLESLEYELFHRIVFISLVLEHIDKKAH